MYQLKKWILLYLNKFLDNKIKETLNEAIRNVIDEELNLIISDPKGNAVNVEAINESFLKANEANYECCIEVAKLIYDLNPTVNQKRALDLLMDLNNKQGSITIKVYFMY